jgi:hypothetical protein
MSSPLIISAVTATLRNIVQTSIDAFFSGVTVTTSPPDKAHDGRTDNQVNIFLYHTGINAAWRNQDPPNRVKPGEVGHPPLALNLHYLVTAYGENNDDVRAQSLLGAAMIALHDMPILDPADLRAALPAPAQPGDQIERVRAVMEPMSLEENSKLWAAFQTNYRLSAAYVASVVLIDSLRPIRAALPVARRGDNDEGVTMLTTFPNLQSFAVRIGSTSIERMGQGSALPGDTLIIRGTGFQADGLAVRLSNNLVTHELVPSSISETEIRVVLPADAPDKWPPGYYALGLIVRDAANILHVSDELPLYLLPTITAFVSPISRIGGSLNLTLSVTPSVWPIQRAALLVGDREMQAAAHPVPANTLTFSMPQAAAGQFYLRLRVDGIDSLIIDPLTRQYDATKRITIT